MIVELNDANGTKFFLISDSWEIHQSADDSAWLTNMHTLIQRKLKDKYSDLIHIYNVTTNSRVKKNG